MSASFVGEFLRMDSYLSMVCVCIATADDDNVEQKKTNQCVYFHKRVRFFISCRKKRRFFLVIVRCGRSFDDSVNGTLRTQFRMR